MLHNKFIDVVRKNRLEDYEASFETSLETESEELSKLAESQRAQEALFRDISELPEQQRAAILLAHAQGFGNKEIAHILGTTVRATESLLGRARRTLKVKFEQRS